jgi:signal transduction histidine kinase
MTVQELETAVAQAKTDEEKIRTRLALLKEIKNTEAQPTLNVAEETLQLIGTRTDLQHEKGRAHLSKGIGLYHLNFYTESLSQMEEALKIFQTIPHPIDLIQALLGIGLVQCYLGNYSKALGYYQDSLTQSKVLNHEEYIFASLNNIGNLYHAIGDYPNSLLYHHQGLSLKRAAQDKHNIAISLNNIGNVYYDIQEIDNAYPYYQESLSLFSELEHRRGIAITLSNLGNVARAREDYKTALTFYEESLSTQKEIQDQRGVLYALLNLGDLNISLNQPESALSFYEECLTLSRQIMDKAAEVETLKSLAKVLVVLKRYTEAEHFLSEGLTMSDESNMTQSKSHILQTQAELYTETGDPKKALEAYKAYHETERKILGEEKQKQLAMMQVRFETEQAKLDLDLQKKEAEMTRLKNEELNKALADAIEANRFKNELLSVAAHDLKNPLQSISGFAQLLKAKSSNPETVEHYSDTIERGAAKMLAIVNELLTTAEHSVMGVRLDLQFINLVEILETIVHSNQPQLAQKQQTMQTHFPEVCNISADRMRLMKVMDNLISNAIKYSETGKTITVTCELITAKPESNQLSYQSVRVSVKDEGQGLSDEDKEKLFGRFQRLSAKPTGGESSTGLGLSIVKQIVELHGGRVWAESEGKGKGTTFFVELPRLIE